MAGSFDEILNLQFDQPAKKAQLSYGLNLVKSLFSNGYDGFLLNRNEQWKANEDFANGKMDVKDFLQKLGIDDGKGNSHINVDPTYVKVIPRYIHTLLGGFMNRDEKPTVKATDALSEDFKENQKKIAAYRMQNREQIARMEAEGGIKLEEGFTPEDDDELDMYYELEYRIPEETFFEKTINKVFLNSDAGSLKRQLLRDAAVYGPSFTRIETYESETLANKVRIRRCHPKRMVHNRFEDPLGRDITLIGEAHPVSILELRRRYPKVSEQTWFKLAHNVRSSKSGFSNLSWSSRFVTDMNRPYDEDRIPIFDFEVKSIEKEYAVQATNSFGKEMYVPKKGKPSPMNGQALERTKYTVYCGVWAIDTDEMIKWEVEPHIIRPYQNDIECFMYYSAVWPDADGSLIPSQVERAIPFVKRLVEVALKIQQMTTTMTPDLVSWDINSDDGVDIGTGGTLKPLELRKVASQTGTIYWNSGDASGTDHERKNPPFGYVQGGNNIQQLNTLIQLYNFWLQRLNDDWGTNPDALGQQLPAKRGASVNNNMIQLANQATEYIYDFYIKLIEQNCNKVAMLLWDYIVLQANEYKRMDGINLIDATFDVTVEMIPKEESKVRMQEKINIALEQGLITLGQSMKLENMDNTKDAEMYLIRLEKKAQEAAAKQQQQQVVMNAQVQQQSLEMKGQMDQNTAQAKAQATAMVNQADVQNDNLKELMKMASQIQQENMKTGKPIPPEMQGLIDYLMQNTLQPAA